MTFDDLFYAIDESDGLNKFFDLFEKFLNEESLSSNKLVEENPKEEIAQKV